LLYDDAMILQNQCWSFVFSEDENKKNLSVQHLCCVLEVLLSGVYTQECVRPFCLIKNKPKQQIALSEK